MERLNKSTHVLPLRWRLEMGISGIGIRLRPLHQPALRIAARALTGRSCLLRIPTVIRHDRHVSLFVCLSRLNKGKRSIPSTVPPPQHPFVVLPGLAKPVHMKTSQSVSHARAATWKRSKSLREKHSLNLNLIFRCVKGHR